MKTMFNKSIFTKVISVVLGLVFALLMLPPFVGNVEAAETESNVQSQSKIIVSMGDSYSAGEGVPEFYDQSLSLKEKVQSHDWLAHRSQKSWSGQLTLPAVSGKMANNRNTNWYFVAASGATTEHIQGYFRKDYYKIYDMSVLTGDVYAYKDYENLDPQIKILNNLRNQGKTVDYITLTLGGNDAKFSDVVTEAVVESTITYLNPGGLSQKLNGIWKDFYKSGGIRDKLRKAYQDIAQAAPEAKIIVAGYPKLMDKNGKGIFSKEAAALVNDSVSRFNDEIEMLVNSCKAEGMKICFVSVEEEFDRQGVRNCLNGVMPLRRSEDIDDLVVASSYSMHPNEKGVEIYRSCVQKKIDQLEKDGGKSEWPTMVSSDERDIVLVLDASGSMDGTPMAETKEAANKFITTVLKEDASIGVVSYENSAMRLADFCMNEKYLKNVIQSINAGGGTNIESGLALADEMLSKSKAKKKIVVLMSDGEPNEGKVGDDLIAYAETLRSKGILVYTLGFFNSVSNKSRSQDLMQKIASDGCHFEVDDAQQLVFFFNDIADQIQGTKYIYVRIACPVDVSVTLNGETLSSKNADKAQRTTFGTLTFEENTKQVADSTDNRIKVLRLREGTEYDVHIEGNGTGTMNYSIGLMDNNGEYNDMREFKDVEITPTTKIDTVAEKAKTSVMNIDENGDGEYDEVLKVDGEGYIEEETEEKVEETDLTYIYIICGVVALISLILLIIVIIKIKKPAVARVTVAVEKPDNGKALVQEPTSQHTTPTAPESVPLKQEPPVPPVAPAPTVAFAAQTHCFCKRCGKKMETEAKFCPACGTPNEHSAH